MGLATRRDPPNSTFALDVDPALLEWLEELQRNGAARTVRAGDVLSTRSLQTCHHSQQVALEEMASSLQFGAFPAGPGVWIGRNVNLPKSVQIIPPVIIAANTQIGQFVTLGPHAVISAGCLIDEHSRIRNTLVLSGSYVGRHLQVENSIINHNRLINLTLDTVISTDEAFLLGRVDLE